MTAAPLISLPPRRAGAPGAAVDAVLRGHAAQGSALVRAVARG
jgi:hypothetical protein